MADGFSVSETIDRPASEVWAYLTDFRHAGDWMTGVEDMIQITGGALGVGARFKFKARGKERETEVTAWEPGRRLALTSTQGGVTATYEYSLLPSSSGSTELRLEASCHAQGLWKLLHPLVVLAMKRSDSSHLTKLKRAMDR